MSEESAQSRCCKGSNDFRVRACRSVYAVPSSHLVQEPKLSTSPLWPRASRAAPEVSCIWIHRPDVAYVLRHKSISLLTPRIRMAAHPNFQVWLLPHGLMGACALLLGPMQFSDRLRQRFTKFHRVVGPSRSPACSSPLPRLLHPILRGAHGRRSFLQAPLPPPTRSCGCSPPVSPSRLFFNGKSPAARQWMTAASQSPIVFLEVRVVLGVTDWERLPTVPSMKPSCGLALPSPSFSPISPCVAGASPPPPRSC